MSAALAQHLPGEAHAGRLLRGRVWLHRHALDRRLAAGSEPASSPELSVRAEQLMSDRCRRSFASGITRVVEAAEKPNSPATSAAPVMRREILAARGRLTALADLLRSDEPLQVRGLALIDDLLTSGGSPVFSPQPEDNLERAVGRIRAALLLR